MSTDDNKPVVLWGGWAMPFVGLAATVGGILIAFARIGSEPVWETVLVGVAFSVVTAVSLLVPTMNLRFSARPAAWWHLVFPTLAVIYLVAFVLVPGCYLRWHG